MEVTLNRPKSDNPLIKNLTPEEFSKIATDPVYFIDGYCWTFDPRTAPYHFPFKLWDYQKDYVKKLRRYIETGENVLTEKSRDMGASWCALALLLWYWLFVPGSQILLGSRKEDLVDNGTLDSLFGKLDYMLDRLPFAPEGFSKQKHRSSLKLINPMNGNVLKGESANAEFARQGRYKAIFVDEFAFWETADSAWAAAGESAPCIVATTTPPKKPHFVKALRLSGLVDVITLHWRLHPLKDDAWYEKQKSRKTEEEIAIELDINWEGAITGRYLPEVSHARVGDFPYMPNWPLWVSHDFGFHPDPHVLQWYQVNPENGRYRIVESFEKSGKVIDWFLPFFGFPFDSEHSYHQSERDLIAKVGQWKKGTHFGDPAGKAANEVSGKSPIARFADFDIYVNTNDRANDHYSRRNAAAKILMNLDVNDTPNNRYFMECVKNHRLPEIGVGSQRTTENSKPVHDWTSHESSALQYFGVNVEWDPRATDPQENTFQNALARVRSNKQAGFTIGRY